MIAQPPFTLIDNNDNFIVIDKCPGINFHDEGDINDGLFNQVKDICQCEQLYPVHRLDKMTSGLLLFAKNLATAQQFQIMFSEHSIEKYYLAISDKKPTKKQGLIKGDMSKSRRGMWKLMRSQNNPAITQFFSYALGQGQRLYLLKPHSGKTHQIRVALSSISAPIIGDNYYYPTSNSPEADRGYLHAFYLGFTLGEKMYRYIAKPAQGELFNNPATIEQIDKLLAPNLLSWPKV